MNKQKLFLIILAAAGIIAAFLPWVSGPAGLVLKGTSGDGWITSVLFATVLVVCMGGDQKSPLEGKFRWGAIAPAALAGIIALTDILEYKNLLPFDSGKMEKFGSLYVAFLKVEYGLYLVPIIATGILSIVFFFPTKGKPVL